MLLLLVQHKEGQPKEIAYSPRGPIIEAGKLKHQLFSWMAAKNQNFRKVFGAVIDTCKEQGQGEKNREIIVAAIRECPH